MFLLGLNNDKGLAFEFVINGRKLFATGRVINLTRVLTLRAGEFPRINDRDSKSCRESRFYIYGVIGSVFHAETVSQ